MFHRNNATHVYLRPKYNKNQLKHSTFYNVSPTQREKKAAFHFRTTGTYKIRNTFFNYQTVYPSLQINFGWMNNSAPQKWGVPIKSRAVFVAGPISLATTGTGHKITTLATHATEGCTPDISFLSNGGSGNQSSVFNSCQTTVHFKYRCLCYR